MMLRGERRPSMRRRLLINIAVLCVPSVGVAQSPTSTPDIPATATSWHGNVSVMHQPIRDATPRDSGQWVTRSALYGTGLGALGAGVGMLGMSLITDDPGSRLVGAFVVGSFTLPAGVHAGNRDRGSLSWSVASSYGWAAAGCVYAASQGTDDAYLTAAIATPVLQLVTSIIIEAITSR